VGFERPSLRKEIHRWWNQDWSSAPAATGDGSAPAAGRRAADCLDEAWWFPPSNGLNGPNQFMLTERIIRPQFHRQR